MNILVTGANGQLGSEMRIIARESTNHYIFTDIFELDIIDPEAVMKTVLDNDIHLVINCAAYTNVDKAEDDFEMAELINAKAVEILAQAMKTQDGTLIHISTDYVFGGTENNTPCREDQKPNPTGVYGVTKLHGEEAIHRVGCHHIILRTAWLYSEFGHNFVKTMLFLLDNKPDLKVVFDQAGTPTYAYDLARVIYDLVENRKYEGHDGTYHFSNEGVCSWFDFTKAIASITGNTKCKVLPCHSDEFPSKVVRPSYSVLDKTLLKDTFGIEIPYWVDSLKICLEHLK